MKELLDSFLQNGLADFEGLRIEGSIPIKAELINRIIADFLTDDEPAKGDAPTSVETASVPAQPLVASAPKASKKGDRAAIQKLVKSLIKRAEVKAADGKIVLEFEMER